MCVQYLRGCSVPRGVQYRGGYHEYHGGVQYRGGYHDKCGGYLECLGDIMSIVGVILSTVGDTQYRGRYHDTCGGYHEYHGGVQYRGGIPFFEI